MNLQIRLLLLAALVALAIGWAGLGRGNAALEARLAAGTVQR